MRTDRILGVDPSFNRTGWAIVDRGGSLVSCGVIKPAGGSRGERLVSIYEQFRGVLKATAPVAAYLEKPGGWQRKGGTRPETVEAMAMSRAAMLIGCGERNVAAFEAEFHAVRNVVMGNRNIRVDGVVEFLERRGIILPKRPRGGVDIDIANAVVMALYGFRCLEDGSGSK